MPLQKKTKYRSKFEEAFAKNLPDTFEYETHKFPYTLPTKYYIPDFVDKQNKIIIETKGFLRDYHEREKMIAVKRQHWDWTIAIKFQYPDRRIPKLKMTHREWATKYGFIVL